MKTLVFLLSFSAAALLGTAAKAAQIELVAGKEEMQTFYIDAKKLRADSASFRLTGADGREVPFSFDLRYSHPVGADPQRFNGRFVRKPDGNRSARRAPASEDAFAHPGWFSFRKLPGVERYTLSYATGATDAIPPRPNPAVRPWWIELMRDPQMHDLELLSFRKGTLTPLPDGGVETNVPFQWRAEAYVVDPRLKGRRLIAVLRSAGLSGYFNVPFHDAVRAKRGATIHTYFKIPSGAPTDLFVEGRVANRPGDLLRAKYGSMSARPPRGQGPAQVYSLHLQSPPEEIPITFRLNSSLYDLGDLLEVATDGLGYELLQPVGKGVARLDRWEPQECAIAVMLETVDGKAVKTFTGKTIRLEGVPPGRYHLKTALQSRRPIPETIATETFVVEIQNGPDWAVR